MHTIYGTLNVISLHAVATTRYLIVQPCYFFTVQLYMDERVHPPWCTHKFVKVLAGPSSPSNGHPSWRQTTCASLSPKSRSVAVACPWFSERTSKMPEHPSVNCSLRNSLEGHCAHPDLELLCGLRIYVSWIYKIVVIQTVIQNTTVLTKSSEGRVSAEEKQ